MDLCENEGRRQKQQESIDGGLIEWNTTSCLDIL